MISGLNNYGKELNMSSPSENPQTVLPHHFSHETMEDFHDVEDLSGHDIEAEDAHLLLGVSLSREASRLMSSTTPAAEKAAAIDDLDGGGLHVSDEDVTSPLEPTHYKTPHPWSPEQQPKEPQAPNGPAPVLDMPSPSPQDLSLPSPWIAGPKPWVVERPEEPRSALRGAFDMSKRRSSSGGADTLKKFLPSMPRASSFSINIPSPSFFSSNSNQKNRGRAFSLYRDIGFSALNSSTSGVSRPAQSANNKTITTDTVRTSPASGLKRPALRRIASDDSALYYSLSRASSLGDDTRFENQHEMANSGIKALRDSLQDRTSFKLPSMPSMPHVPNFNLATNFTFNMNSSSIQNTNNTDANSIGDDVPGSSRAGDTQTLHSVNAPRMGGISVSNPGLAIESLQSAAKGISNDQLERAMAKLTGDIVIMGGYRGSVLRSAEPPHRQLWVPVKVGLNLRKVNLEVGLDPEDEERIEERIFSSGMLQNIGPVDISKRLFKKLRECDNAKNGKLRIWDYGYDWRLSPHLLSKRLLKFMESLPSNQQGVAREDKGVLVVAHSLGGLITRHAVNKRPELFSGVIYVGVPKSCVNILGPLRNGDSVMLSSRVLTAQVNFTFRTSFVLLPLEGYCFKDKTTGEEYPVDFFDVDDWIKYRWSPCTDPPLPPKPQHSGGLVNILKPGSLPSLQLPGMKPSNGAIKRTSQDQTPSSPFPVHTSNNQQSHMLNALGADVITDGVGRDKTLAPQMGNRANPVKHGHSTNSSISTTVTIPRDKAIIYLRRTLGEIKQFKLELAHNLEHEEANRYPPFAIIYGKSIPTVYAAQVDGRDGIARADSYDNLAFASGDGVCLSREAMLPNGYHIVKGGRISSDRGHITLLGDLNAVGRAFQAVIKGRVKGMGLPWIRDHSQESEEFGYRLFGA